VILMSSETTPSQENQQDNLIPTHHNLCAEPLELADACHGDHRPDCPILRDLESSGARTTYGQRHAPSEKQVV
jgi:hypothetical protein